MKEGNIVGIFVFPQRGGPALERAEVAVGQDGLEGDQKRSPRRAVTLLSVDAWGRAMAELGADLAPQTRRANILVSGIDLEACVGRRVDLGETVLEIGGETTPCQLMDEQCPGLLKALKPEMRGGVFGRVEKGGLIRRGDPVRVRA